MYTWKDISIYGPNNPPRIQIKRTDAMEHKYSIHKQTLKEINKTTSEHIMDTVFNNDSLYVFNLNEFPYSFDPKIQHWLLWINPKIKEKDIDIKHIDSLIKTKFKKNYTYFRNITEFQSIKAIAHYHILVNNSSNL